MMIRKMRKYTPLWVAGFTLLLNACGKDDSDHHKIDDPLTPKCEGSSHFRFRDSSFSYALPTAFTPNGDGINDGYRPEATNADVTEYHIVIYDDVANKTVFESNSMNMIWDGSGSTGYKHSVLLHFTDEFGNKVDTCTYLYKLSSEEGCTKTIAADRAKYIFQDQLDPETGEALYQTVETFCP
ncbi:MAG TPA: gliding motility-associated C-terminal domain-containing protein [Flavipsychrobacter sp.]|nr:gliding motility-associated C-terminal domain-containing protein [Flavipsychrobacter sp.]